MFGEGTDAEREGVKKRLVWSGDGWTKKVLDDIKEKRKKDRGSKRKEAETLIRYVSNNEEEMRDDVFREKG